MLDNGSDMHDTNGSFDMDCYELADAMTPKKKQSAKNMDGTYININIRICRQS
jgi:hypothetical protein